MATVYFMERIIAMTQVQDDSGHIPMFVYNNPQVPDRTAYILDSGMESPYPALLKTGQIVKEHCDCIALPCVTAHIFHDRLQNELGIPVFNMIEETTAYLKRTGITKAGLLATDGTIAGGIFQKSMDKEHLKLLTPEKQEQEQIMRLIYDGVKADGKLDMNVFYEISEHLKNQGAETIVLGCTELSVLKGRYGLGETYLDSLEVTAAAVIKGCGGVLKEAYQY